MEEGITFHLKHSDPLDLKTWFCIRTYLCRLRHDAGNGRSCAPCAHGISVSLHVT